jgi:hypothetical protein
LPQKINDEYVEQRIPNGGSGKDGYEISYSWGLCGQDATRYNTEDLSREKFAEISFDTNTVFSNEQNSKYRPQELIERGKDFGLGLSKLHKAGIDGRGIDVTLIDWNFDYDNPEFVDEDGNSRIVEYNNEHISQKRKFKEGFHGKTVSSLLAGSNTGVAPKCNISFYAIEPKEDLSKQVENILDALQSNGKKIPQVISLSSSLNSNEKNEQYTERLEKAGCDFVNSPNFLKHFIFHNRNNYMDIDDNENLSAQKLSTNINSKKDWKRFRVEGTVKRKLLQAKLASKKMSDEDKVHIERDIQKYDMLLNMTYEQAIEFEKNKIANTQKFWKQKIHIPCGGRSYPQIGGGYMYCGHSSVSWTIPQVAGLLVLAKQMDPNVSYEEFSQIAKDTCNKNSEGYMVVNPEGIVRQININNQEKSDKGVNGYKEIYENSSGLISNLDRVIESEKGIKESLKSNVINSQDIQQAEEKECGHPSNENEIVK